MNDDITNYPLSWPVGWERSKTHYRSRFKTHSIIATARVLSHCIRLMGGRNMIISTNLRVRNDGIPYSSQRTPDDPGVAVYFERKGKSICFPCDAWKTVEENLWAITCHLESMRDQERWKVGSLDQAFAGYAALPDPNARKWWEVLNIPQTASNEEIRKAYISLAQQYHPDRPGGNTEMFQQIQSAYDLAMGKR